MHVLSGCLMCVCISNSRTQVFYKGLSVAVFTVENCNTRLNFKHFKAQAIYKYCF